MSPVSLAQVHDYIRNIRMYEAEELVQKALQCRDGFEVLELCPLDRILIETDSPYLSPVPMRGKRNDSRNLRYVIEKAAEIKGLPPEEIEAITFENGCTLFDIKNA